MLGSKMILCGHCGNRAIFHRRAEGTKNGDVPDYSGKYDGQYIIYWRVLECASCGEPTLEQTRVEYSIEPNIGEVLQESYGQTILLYPVDKPPLANLPKTIEKRYMDALGSKDVSPSAFAVLAGKTLEAVCNNEHMTGSTLEIKLKNLIGSDRIPPVLAQMAQQIRLIRNLGAHDAEDDVTEEDVRITLDFLEAILEYLYIAPAKIEALQARLTKADAKKGRRTEKDVTVSAS